MGEDASRKVKRRFLRVFIVVFFCTLENRSISLCRVRCIACFCLCMSTHCCIDGILSFPVNPLGVFTST